MSETSARTTPDLIPSAWRARRNAYAPYSEVAVGAAVLTGSGKVYVGANVENASYGLTACAERVAIWSPIAAGEREIVAVAVVADADPGVSARGAWGRGIDVFGRTP